MYKITLSVPEFYTPVFCDFLLYQEVLSSKQTRLVGTFILFSPLHKQKSQVQTKRLYFAPVYATFSVFLLDVEARLPCLSSFYNMDLHHSLHRNLQQNSPLFWMQGPLASASSSLQDETTGWKA